MACGGRKRSRTHTLGIGPLSGGGEGRKSHQGTNVGKKNEQKSRHVTIVREKQTNQNLLGKMNRDAFRQSALHSELGERLQNWKKPKQRQGPAPGPMSAVNHPKAKQTKGEILSKRIPMKGRSTSKIAKARKKNTGRPKRTQKQRLVSRQIRGKTGRLSTPRKNTS